MRTTTEKQIIKMATSHRANNLSWKQVENRMGKEGVLSPTGHKLKANYLSCLMSRARRVPSNAQSKPVTKVVIPEYNAYKGFVAATLALDTTPETKIRLLKAAFGVN